MCNSMDNGKWDRADHLGPSYNSVQCFVFLPTAFVFFSINLIIIITVLDWCLTEQHQYFTKNSKQLLRIYLNIDENMLRKFLRFSNTWRYFGFSPSQISTNILTCGCFDLKINQLPANQEPQFRAEITFFYIFYLNQIQWLPVICVLINFDG